MSHRLKPRLCPLLTEDIVTSLKRYGIYSVSGLLCSRLESVASFSGITLSLLQTIQRMLALRMGPHPLSGRVLLEEAEKHKCCFSLGCCSVDEVLGGGVYSGDVVEVWGTSGSGKTQLCHSLSARVASSTGYSVAYVCGSCDFSPSRLEQLLLSQHVTGEALVVAMEKVRVFQAFHVFELLDTLRTLQNNITHQMDSYHANIGLVIVDPVTLYLAPLLGGHVILSQVGGVLRDLARLYFLAVVYTNNVVADMKTTDRRGGGVRAALGQLWSSVPSLRLNLSLCHQQPLQLYAQDGQKEECGSSTARLLTVSMAIKQRSASMKALFFITSSGLHSASSDRLPPAEV